MGGSGEFPAETSDPDQVGPNSNISFCEQQQCLGSVGGPRGKFQFLTPPTDPLLTALNLTAFNGGLVSANFRGVTEGYEPFVYQVRRRTTHTLTLTPSSQVRRRTTHTHDLSPR